MNIKIFETTTQFNLAPEKLLGLKRRVIFQASFFRTVKLPGSKRDKRWDVSIWNSY